MSIIIHISKDSENINDLSETDGNVSKNIPHETVSKSNNLSEISAASSKYTLSVDDIISNISFESNNYSHSKSSNEIDNEIVIKNKIIKNATEIDNCAVIKDSSGIQRYIFYNIVICHIFLRY